MVLLRFSKIKIKIKDKRVNGIYIDNCMENHPYKFPYTVWKTISIFYS
jgi:hypothetical protein